MGLAVEKGPDAFRTISEVAEDLDLPQHVLRFWETRFAQIKPLKRGGGRRYYRPQDIELLRGIRALLYGEGYTIRGVQRILREQGARFVIAASQGLIDAGEMMEESPEERPRRLMPADDEADAKRMAERLAGARVPAEPPPEMPAPSLAPTLTPDEARRLEATLSDLLECKRLLDQVR